MMTFALPPSTSFPDFERHDDDELGFRKNDIITIISQRDEHCWIGELNGLRGQFFTYTQVCTCNVDAPAYSMYNFIQM